MQIEYSPKKEEKQNPIPNMEGHLHHLPIGQKTAFTEKQWKERYFKIHEAHLLWFAVGTLSWTRIFVRFAYAKLVISK